MSLHVLAGRISQSFEVDVRPDDQNVVLVKDGNSRDVVTAKDQELEGVVRSFMREFMPASVLLCEEDSDHRDGLRALHGGDVLVVDPLDGSNNFALGLPEYGFMACHVSDALLRSSVVVLPERDMYLVWTPSKLITSRRVAFGLSQASAPVYYAYPPRLGDSQVQARTEILRLIDARSGGVYRYGSACTALYRLLTGQHQGFVGQRIRLWDALPYLPLIEAVGLKAYYSISGLSISLVAGYDEVFTASACAVLEASELKSMQAFRSDEPLELS